MGGSVWNALRPRLDEDDHGAHFSTFVLVDEGVDDPQAVKNLVEIGAVALQSKDLV